jgi:hypothetical protein
MKNLNVDVQSTIYAIKSEIIRISGPGDDESRALFKNMVQTSSDPLASVRTAYKTLCVTRGITPLTRLIGV